MKNIKRLSIIILVLVVMFSSSINTEAATNKLFKYRKMAKQIEQRYGLNVIDSSKLTYKKLTHRKKTVIVERCIGKVRNKQKDGKVLNPPKDAAGYYISYKGVKCKKGDIIVTYFLWNPENNIEDDIIARWDFVIKK